MELLPLNSVFEITYGNKFDLKKMTQEKDKSVAFIARTAKNNGVVAFVDKTSKDPYPSGLITVALGGAILETFLQPFDFYTAQNVAVLKPIREMSDEEKLYYCLAIKANKFRYGAFGREANRSLKTLLVPKKFPERLSKTLVSIPTPEPKIDKKINLTDRKWEWFVYNDLFNLSTEKFVSISEAEKTPGEYAFVSTGSVNNGIVCYTGINKAKTYPAGCITVASSGNAGEAFYQAGPFKVTNMVIILKPKFQIDKYIGMFLTTLIRAEKFRYSYGRKSGLERMKVARIKLPVNGSDKPDWDFISTYIQSLNYSGAI